MATAGASRPLSGPTKRGRLALDGDEAPVGADARVDDREHDGALGEVLHRAHEGERAGAHVVRRQLVGEVDDRESGATPSMTPLQTPTNSSASP